MFISTVINANACTSGVISIIVIVIIIVIVVIIAIIIISTYHHHWHCRWSHHYHNHYVLIHIVIVFVVINTMISVWEIALHVYSSFITEPWFEMYLRDRRPLLLNHNPALIFADEEGAGRSGPGTQVSRAARLVHAAMTFDRTLASESLQPLRSTPRTSSRVAEYRLTDQPGGMTHGGEAAISVASEKQSAPQPNALVPKPSPTIVSS